jgi:hypothetical protein
MMTKLNLVSLSELILCIISGVTSLDSVAQLLDIEKLWVLTA